MGEIATRWCIYALFKEGGLHLYVHDWVVQYHSKMNHFKYVVKSNKNK